MLTLSAAPRNGATSAVQLAVVKTAVNQRALHNRYNAHLWVRMMAGSDRTGQSRPGIMRRTLLHG